MPIDSIVYHGDCPDGFCAAFVAWTVNTGAKLIPATYGKPLADEAVAGKHVLVVDFSWPREETLRLKSLAASMIVLDHHKTAEAALAGLDFCVFDMDRSGAQIAWDYCIGGERPWFVDYVADRDLWRWKLPNSRAVSAYLMALPHTTEAWAVLKTMAVEDAILLGRGARAHVEHYMEKVCAQKARGEWGGYTVDVVNAAYPNISDVGNKLCEDGAQIGLGWFVRGDGLMQFSLRSIGDIDVSVLAAMQGGGGHKNAAGFQKDQFAGMALLGQILRESR